MKSAKRGTRTLAEVTNISQHGIWLFFKGSEYFMPFEKYPWFRQATVEQIQDIEATPTGHFHWPALDVDLHVDILEHPERFPLRTKSA